VGHLLKRDDVARKGSSVRLPERDVLRSKGAGAVEGPAPCFRPGVLAVGGGAAGYARTLDGSKG
jgi:hypothetical protein